MPLSLRDREAVEAISECGIAAPPLEARNDGGAAYPMLLQRLKEVHRKEAVIFRKKRRENFIVFDAGRITMG